MSNQLDQPYPIEGTDMQKHLAAINTRITNLIEMLGKDMAAINAKLQTFEENADRILNAFNSRVAKLEVDMKKNEIKAAAEKAMAPFQDALKKLGDS
jgi:hypothetical protein